MSTLHSIGTVGGPPAAAASSAAATTTATGSAAARLPDIVSTRRGQRAVLAEVRQLSPSRDQARLAESALKKMTGVSRALAGTTALGDAMTRIMAERCRESDQKSKLAVSTVKSRFDKLAQKNLKELDELKKRTEAERSSGLWSKLVDLFKGIAAALSAVSSIFTGPVGMVGAVLLVASIVIAHTAPESWGRWVSMGLSLAGAAFSLGASLATEVAKTTTTLVLNLAETASEVVAATGTIVKSVHDKQGLDAKAALAEIKALCQRLLSQAEDEREGLKLELEAQDRCVRAVSRSLQLEHQVALAAGGRSSP